ncbi:MAG: MarR family transcriptional regulator [Eubacteriales bacterium]|nr:MarR family transcriptional regulator [Eubacteriales bacterium]
MDKHETAKNLMFSLAQVAQFARQNLFSDNLSQSEYLIGSVMYESKKPAMSMTELMARTQMSAPALSRFLSRMEERGYAVRFHDEDNKKNVMVALTDAAREKIDTLREQNIRQTEDFVDKFSLSDSQTLIKLIDKIVNMK